jgi:hypothetical protein
VSTPEQHLMAALEGMPELAEALAELRAFTDGEVEIPDKVPSRLRTSFLLGLGRYRATELLKIIDRAAGR